ncbi:HPF/RaiA family ribosome-associated protein [Cognatilysobacter terrigena]|uniref:HPF/RaiA family ribosome-associated protein n=1 Tax=Cognatilysobacter terrigena TaxID=2488749 RepID=UPI00105B697B|nr:HPF/RaiA family ribosome-associated protein [Lysobacter terrigena]
MHIEINHDNHIQYDESVERHVRQTLDSTLSRFADQVTRIEVHLHDKNAERRGNGDRHCLLEAKVEGRPPLAASEDADTIAAAITGAAKKLQRRLDSDLGRLH